MPCKMCGERRREGGREGTVQAIWHDHTVRSRAWPRAGESGLVGPCKVRRESERRREGTLVLCKVRRERERDGEREH
jgi:hypothetical protein